MVLVCTMRRTPASRAAFTTVSAPRALIRSNTPSSLTHCSGMPIALKTSSQWFTAVATDGGSVTSPCTIFTSSGRTLRPASGLRASTTTSSPRACSARATAFPTFPVAPVTRTFTTASYGLHNARRGRPAGPPHRPDRGTRGIPAGRCRAAAPLAPCDRCRGARLQDGHPVPDRLARLRPDRPRAPVLHPRADLDRPSAGQPLLPACAQRVGRVGCELLHPGDRARDAGRPDRGGEWAVGGRSWRGPAAASAAAVPLRPPPAGRRLRRHVPL